MSTTKQDNDFGREFLENIVDFIQSNFEVYDVFSDSVIIEFAATKKPEDVFDEKELQSWAENNGYVKEN